jgi:hypothetical protein
VIATGTYTDLGLRRLRAPARDAADLARVLADPGIGGFTVNTVIDQPAQQIRLAVEDFLAERGTGDLLLVYLSCHGLLDARRRLYFAASDTRKDRLGATGVESAWVLDQLEHCRARRQVLILDSCFSGAFAHGAKGEADLGLRDRFLGQGRGRVVLTASTATEYSFEGDPTGAAAPVGSVFTAALVQGLRTGEADTDHDGHVSVDDAYAYVFDQVQAAGAAQTPQRWLYGAEGKILLARSPTGAVITPASLPESLRLGLDSPSPIPGGAGRVPTSGVRGNEADPLMPVKTRERHRVRWTTVLAVAVLAILGFAAYEFIANVVHARHAVTSSSQHSQTSSPVAAQTLAPASAVAFGVDGTADGENPQNAMLAIGGDPSRPWHSQWYATPDFGGLKAGTGLLLDMGHPVSVSAVRLSLGGGSGTDLQLRAGSKPVLADLPRVASASGAGDKVQWRLSTPVRARYLLVWVTKLPLDNAGTYQAAIWNISVQGWP